MTCQLTVLRSDTTPNFEVALPYFTKAHPCKVKPTPADLGVIRTLASYVSQRSALILGACVFSLWELRHETESEYIQAHSKPLNSTRKMSLVAEAKVENALPETKVAFNGSVIERYPGYLENCQRCINALVSESEHVGKVELVPALESSILGAAVALACAEGEKKEILV